MATDSILTGEPEYHQCQAARLLGCCSRTIRRDLVMGKFPVPDGHEWVKGRWVGVWKLSTIQKYRESRMRKAA